MAEGTQTCSTCGEQQPLINFHADSRSASGRRKSCKRCRSDQLKAWYAANQIRQRDRQRARVAANPERTRDQDTERYHRHRSKRVELAQFVMHRRRAAEYGVEFDPSVTTSALRERCGDNCIYCERRMSFDLVLDHGYDPSRATVEHILSMSRGGGHTWQNTTLACWACNCSKGNQTVEEWRGDTPRGTYLDRGAVTENPLGSV